MKAGRELDALVAEKVMGWRFEPGNMRGGVIDPTVYPTEVGRPDRWWVPDGGSYFTHPMPYSTSIEAAWSVVGKLGARPFRLERVYYQTKREWRFEACFEGALPASGDTAPMAIVTAALKAVGA